ncbi:pentapeptide repeat-containing protein [Tersicoccus sp. MR15.9]|uniref:pentapeptide repeat-containing protein n=1 Tax=Tersicoccus mangrovi TaxID=3121635 RepID=UPI002FE59F3B
MANEGNPRRVRRIALRVAVPILLGAAVFGLASALMPGSDRILGQLLVVLGITAVGVVAALLSSRTREALRRSISSTSLLGAVIGMGAISVLVVLLSLGFYIALLRETAAQYAVQFALWTAAGLGGVVALVVAYRRQRVHEDGLFVERFGAAAKQLGDSDPAVRISGVYAMAGVADEGTPAQMQQCIDVLCGYLRLPYDPDHGSSGLAEKKQADKVGWESTYTVRANDRQVRQTIQAIIAQHLMVNATPNWVGCNLDFRGAVLEEVDFSSTHFTGMTRFNRASFIGTTLFAKSICAGDTQFDGAHFIGPTAFVGTDFSGRTTFDGARFDGDIEFITAQFLGTTTFHDTHFSGHTWFDRARFSGRTWFERARFSISGKISFDSPTAWNPGPVFDWDDESGKPANVKSDKWPPTVVPPNSGG